MKTKIILSISLLFIFAALGQSSAQAQDKLGNKNKIPLIVDPNVIQRSTDLTMPAELYFTGAKKFQIDFATDKYVPENGTMQLKTSDATRCQGNTCIFNIGFIVKRSGNVNSVLQTYALLLVENVGFVGNTVTFPDKQKIQHGVLPLELKTGMNKVTFTIDPYKKKPETNEDNNSFSVNINVVPTLMPGPKIKLKEREP